MRFLIYGLNYAPEPTGVGRYTGEMAAWLKAQGHEVHVVTAYPYYPAWRIADGYAGWRYGHETLDGIPVRRCPLWVPAAPTTLPRLLHLILFVITSFPLVIWMALRWRPDIVWTTEPTVMGAPAALIAARLARATSWLHVQDIELGAVSRLGMIKSRLVQRLTLGLYCFVLRRFTVVSTISRTMAAQLQEFGAPAVTQFPNWVDVASIRPGVDTTALRRELGIPTNAKVALYSGNMGEKQGIETILEAARRLEARHELHFILCGAGAARQRLEREAAGLANVAFHPLQPAERLNELLNLADIHLLPQRPGTTLFAMPSKLGGMLASGRAIVAQAELDSEFADLLLDAAIVVPSDDAEAFTEAIVRLLDSPDLRARLGASGRRLAVEKLSRDALLSAFVDHARMRLAHRRTVSPSVAALR